MSEEHRNRQFQRLVLGVWLSMVVDLNLTSLKRLQRKHEGGGFLLGFTSNADSQDVLPVVAAAVATANKQFIDDVIGNLMYGAEPIATPRASIVYVTECDSPEALERWISVLVNSLESVGWAGRVGPARDESCFYDHPDHYVDSYVAGLVIPIDLEAYQADLSAGRGRRRWLVDSERTAALVDLMTAFVLDGPGDTFFRQGLIQLRVPPESAREIVATAIAQAPPVALTRVGPDKQLARAMLGTLGHVHYELHLPGQGWQDHVEVLTDHVDRHADLIDYAFVRTGWSVSVGWRAIVDRRPPNPPSVGGGYSDAARELDAGRVPDAYAVQWLTDDHVAKAADLIAWDVAPLATGLRRVTARPIAPWFADPEPVPKVLEQARADFGPMILTQGDIDAVVQAHREAQDG